MDQLFLLLGAVATLLVLILGVVLVADFGPPNVRLVRYHNVCWLEMEGPFRPSFELGLPRVRDAGWRETILEGVQLATPNPKINERFRSSQLLRGFAKDVFNFPGAPARSIRVSADIMVVNLGRLDWSDKSVRVQVLAMRKHLSATVPLIMRDLRRLSDAEDIRKR